MGWKGKLFSVNILLLEFILFVSLMLFIIIIILMVLYTYDIILMVSIFFHISTQLQLCSLSYFISFLFFFIFLVFCLPLPLAYSSPWQWRAALMGSLCPDQWSIQTVINRKRLRLNAALQVWRQETLSLTICKFNWATSVKNNNKKVKSSDLISFLPWKDLYWRTCLLLFLQIPDGGLHQKHHHSDWEAVWDPKFYCWYHRWQFWNGWVEMCRAAVRNEGRGSPIKWVLIPVSHTTDAVMWLNYCSYFTNGTVDWWLLWTC